MAGAKHTVHFEPVDMEIEVAEDETVLEAAFRQGLMLMHGCKEGQCAACKSFLLEGEVDLERYSTFALADYEQEEGYTLLCRAHAYSDLDVELLNFDEEMLKSGVPIQDLRAEVESIDALTHDISRLRLKLIEPQEMAFNAGQYVDIRIPGTEHTRAFSMANTRRAPTTGWSSSSASTPGAGSPACSPSASRPATSSRSRALTECSSCARAPSRTSCSSAAAPGWRRSSRC